MLKEERKAAFLVLVSIGLLCSGSGFALAQVDPCEEQTFYRDADDDGYGNPSSTAVGCDQPSGYVTNGQDCDDSDKYIHPGAEEVCNEKDDDCDGSTDEGVKTTFYRDYDGDGYGNPSSTAQGCDQPSGYVTNGQDCDDSDKYIHPGAEEVCNEKDDDCDGSTDEGVKTTFYRDYDGDGYGNASSTAQGCDQPSGYVTNGQDCDDSDKYIHPGAEEVCNEKDDDCDGSTDEGVKTTFYRDADGDGYGNPSSTAQGCDQPSGYVTNGQDCDDSDKYIHPGAEEVCNEKDDDCDGSTDEGVKTTFYRDADGDGYGNPSSTAQGCEQPSGYVTNGQDCDDSDRYIHPGAEEVCNEKDDDCDGSTDEGVRTIYYRDADGDGYGNPSSTSASCSQPSGYVANDDDCNDSNRNIHPGADEIANGLDDDCDGFKDEGVETTYYRDADNDGYGDPSFTVNSASQPSGYVTNGDDCDDSDRNVHPDADEICNEKDDNCNTAIDEGVGETYFRDKDGDGFGDESDSSASCGQPTGYVSVASDCDDEDPKAFPGQTWYKDLDDDGYSDGVIDDLSCLRPEGYKIEAELFALDNDPDDQNASIVGPTGKVNKAIIVAGGGAHADNSLWSATSDCANYAYRILLRQGYEKGNVRYLSEDSAADCDGNGSVDDVSAGASCQNLEDAILDWSQDAYSLFIYMVDHGGEGTFRIGRGEILTAEQLDNWLDVLQTESDCEVTILYDACRSGSFLPLLKPPQGKTRVVAASAAADQEAIFVTGGTISFSSFFWCRMDNGDAFYDAFDQAKKGVSTVWRQAPAIDADGDGVENEKEDKARAAEVRIGNEIAVAGDLPYIGDWDVSPSRRLAIPATATVFAENVVDADGIARVWAVMVPPDYEHPDPDDPVVDLPTYDLVPMANGRFEAEIDSLTEPGTYLVYLYAQDTNGDIGQVRSIALEVDENATQSLALYFPHAMLYDGWQTEIGIVNTSECELLTGEVNAYDADGDHVGEAIPIALAPAARRWIDVGTEFDSSAFIRYLVFEGQGDQVAGYLRFALPGRYGMAVPAASRINSDTVLVSHIASEPRWITEICIVNTASSEQNVVIEFNTGDEKTWDLPAGGHFCSTIREMFDGKPRLDIRSAAVRNAAEIVGVEIFRDDAGNIMSGILLSDELTTEMYYPHVATQDGWGTGIVAYNPALEDCAVRVVPYSAEGTRLNPVELTIGGGHKYIGVVSALGLPADTAWIALESDRSLTGFELFTRPNIMGGYTGVDIKRRRGCFPRLEPEGSTGIAFVNAGDSAAAVSLTAYDDSGRRISEITMDVPAFAKKIGVSRRLFQPDDISDATHIIFESQSDIVGFQLNVTRDGMILEGLPGL